MYINSFTHLLIHPRESILNAHFINTSLAYFLFSVFYDLARTGGRQSGWI